MPSGLAEWCRAAQGAPLDAVLPGRDAATARLLIANRIGPMVARSLARVDSSTGHPVDEFASLLRDDARLAAEQALRSQVVIRDIAAQLDGAGIPWLLWKGPALSVQAWGDPAWRHHVDLDVVVAPAALEDARDTLARAGWRSRDGLSRPQERAIHGGSRALPLVRDNASGETVLVELHDRFAADPFPSPVTVPEAQAHAETIRLGATRVRTPAGAHALLLLALHATKHGWSQAEEVLSFARLALTDGEAVAGARAIAADAGVSRAMRLACRLVEVLLGRGVGENALGAGGERLDAGLEAAVQECLARMERGDGGWRESHRWTLSWISRPADRARYLARALLAPTPQELKWIRLPDRAVAAYPVVRVARLALRTIGLLS